MARRAGRGTGTGGYAVTLARWLAGRGHDVDLWCAHPPATAAEASFRTRTLRVRWHRGVAGQLALVRAARAVPRAAYDVVQSLVRTLDCDVYRAGGGVHAAWLRAGGRRWRPADRLELRLDRAAMGRARLVVCNSEAVARQARELYGIAPERLRVVRTGVDATRYRWDAGARVRARQHWRVPDAGRVALFVGHGFRRKGLRTAAAAFARAASAHDRLVVLGTDAHAPRHLAAVRSLVGPRLVVAAHTDDPASVLPGADCTILPTLYDAAANTTLEALAACVPPVVSAADGSSEVVPERALCVADPADVEAFARALHAAWAGGAGDRAGSLGARCRSAALEWPVSRNGAAMETLYRELRDGES